MTKDKDQRKEIAFKYGRLNMKSILELYANKSDILLHQNIIQHYAQIYLKSRMKNMWRLFVLDKMLVQDKYDYSYINITLPTLKLEEKYNLVRALGVYLLLWYAEAKHISVGSNTPGLDMVDTFSLVNKPMYRFARSLIVNIIASTTNVDERRNLKTQLVNQL